MKPCPVCENENEDTALVCIHCGSRLEEISTKFVGAPESSVSAPATQIESFIKAELIPEGGIGVQVAGETKPLYATVSWELVIGRTTEESTATDDLLDLANMHAATLGVSRRHILIRRTVSGYEVTDLTSRNGSWLNGERLVPNKAYPLASGSQLRLGNMRLLIMYNPAKK